MDIRVLQYFLTVAQKKSISSAAEALHITQPPLSRQLQSLEEELGKQLFLRNRRGIVLTKEGLILKKRAEEIVKLMEKTRAEVTAVDESVSGDIYLGCAETDAMRIIIRVIRELQNDYPGIRFHISSGNAGNVAERLDEGLFDFGVFIEPADMHHYDFIRLPALDTWGLLMRKDDPLARQKSVTQSDLIHLPLIFTNQEMAVNEFSGWIGCDFSELHIIATYNLPYIASLMVEEGLGYGLCLDGIIQTTEGCPLCFRPLEPRLEVGIIIGWKKNQVFSGAASVFLERLKKSLQTKQ